MSTANEILSRMAEARKRMLALPPILLNSIRIHPDDLAELKNMILKADPTLRSPYFEHGPPMFSGVKLIPDENAERLPRKP